MAERVPIAGVDSSTQQTKLVIVDAATGELLGSSALPHPDGTEISPDHWWIALQGVGGGNLRQARALAIAAQQHTTLFLDERGEPVRDALLWNDRRAAAAARRLRDDLGAEEWAQRTGLLPDSAHPVSKLRWLAEAEPERAAAVHAVALPHDWLTGRMLGARAELTTDRSDASATGYWSPADDCYDEGLLDLAFGRRPRLPRVLAPSERAGVTDGGLVLAAGCGDNAATHVALDTRQGDVVVSVGTSTTVSMRTDRFAPDPTGLVDVMADARDGYIPIVAMLNGARTLGAAARLLGVSLARFDTLAARADPAADGLVFLPYLDGERNPERAEGSGALLGLSRRAMTPSSLARAAVLGLACAIAGAVEALVTSAGDPARILLVGGGSRSSALRQAVADLLGRPVHWPEDREHAAFGAARQAAWALTGELPRWQPLATATLVPADDRGWVSEVREAYAAADATHGAAGF